MLALIHLGWAGENLSIEDIKAVFGPAYDKVSSIQNHFETLSKWLHINRASASSFELINRTTIEMGTGLL